MRRKNQMRRFKIKKEKLQQNETIKSFGESIYIRKTNIDEV